MLSTTSPAPVATSESVSASSYLGEVANWDGKSKEIHKAVAAAFEADDYLECIKDLPTLQIEPLSYVNNLDKVSSHPIPSHHARFLTTWRQIVDSLPANSGLRKRCIRALRKTCGLYGILPTSYEVTSVLTIPPGRRPSAGGGFADVWRITDEKDGGEGEVFAVKALRVYEQDPVDKIRKAWSFSSRDGLRVDRRRFV